MTKVTLSKTKENLVSANNLISNTPGYCKELINWI